jgi:hypothetical protein
VAGPRKDDEGRIAAFLEFFLNEEQLGLEDARLEQRIVSRVAAKLARMQ